MKSRTVLALLAVTGSLTLVLAAQGAGGQLDPTFGHGGKVRTAFGSSYTDGVSAVAIQSDGKIVVAGGSERKAQGPYRVALARYLPSGRLDPSFGSGGKILSRVGGNAFATGLAVLPSGKILVSGYGTATSGRAVFLLARYRRNGKLDHSFGRRGVTTVRFPLGDAAANSLALQADGKIVVAGFVQTKRRTKSRFALARFTPGGRPDTTFGSSGRVQIPFGRKLALATSVAIGSDGKIALAGYIFTTSRTNTLVTNYRRWALARVNADGSLDSSFGSGGTVTTQVGTPDPVEGDAAFAVKVLPGGEVLAAGTAYVGYYGFALARYLPNGTLDPTFGNGGKTITGFGPNLFFNEALAMVVAPDLKIVAGGDADGRFGLARYLPNGALDPTFGSGGTVVTRMGPYAFADGLALQPDAKIVLVGGANVRGKPHLHFALARYLAQP